ncbi:cell wall glucanase [Colletotrichum sojae]|uniref:Cell wall glucanase n=1 Tax=Colletotrichum sojae TaxID=2175907 RepID=A0A8H6JGA7_9PEZI|nr:cell wall glucanase [Colletotrichum sojae]
MASTASRRKPRQRDRQPCSGNSHSSSQALPGNPSSTPSTTHLGDFSKIFAFFQNDTNSSSPTAKPSSEHTATASSAPTRPLVLLPFDVVTESMTVKQSSEQVAAKGHDRIHLETDAVSAIDMNTLPPSSTINQSDSSYSSDALSSEGDFDIHLEGGAGLSDVTTPSSTPLSKPAILSSTADVSFTAGERIFKNSLAKEKYSVPINHHQPLADRLASNFASHEQNIKGNYPEQYSRGVHVFIDGSNIAISFYELLKQKLGLAPHVPLPACFMFSALQEVLERDRRIGKRYVLGSKKPFGRAPKYSEDAEAGGYKAIILTRVPKEPPYDSSSDSDGPTPPSKVLYQEQSVDEMLQMQMVNSIFESKPGVMVLVTGDGNDNKTGASKGFPMHVKWALQQGWVVEVYSFKGNSSSCWTNPSFLKGDSDVTKRQYEQLARRLSHHHLDAYVLDMVKPNFQDQLAKVVSQYSSRPSVRSSRNRQHSADDYYTLFSRQLVYRPVLAEMQTDDTEPLPSLRLGNLPLPKPRDYPMRSTLESSRGNSDSLKTVTEAPYELAFNPSKPTSLTASLFGDGLPGSAKSFAMSGYQQRMQCQGTFDLTAAFSVLESRKAEIQAVKI